MEQVGLRISWATVASVVVGATTDLANPMGLPVEHERVGGWLVVFQRSTADELSRSALPHPIAVIAGFVPILFKMNAKNDKRCSGFEKGTNQ